ncbi:terminase small subunit [uncultured Draconibacterium sp.]|uniref:terminase small subunit n=1 Tax=uncultured Draconibacterium sp. TaxID=1573823 RepID=UPI0025D8889C|nr:terminase small subunit [uncultured Draconibacterium sp.]
MDLTAKQELFAQAVAKGKTYADAYREAYPSSKKWKNEAVWVKSSELMTNGKVLVRVKEIQEEIQERNKVVLNEVLQEMARWLRFNIKSIMKEDGAMKSFEEMTDDEAACIASFEVVELFEGKGKDRTMIGYLKKVKLIDKRAISDQFMKHFGAYQDAKMKVQFEDLSHLEDLLKGIKQ